MKEDFKKGELNLIQIIKLSIMVVGGSIGLFCLLKIAYLLEHIYWLLLNK